jgi:hypothetical protein
MPAEQVLVIRPGALGDTLMLLPLIAALEKFLDPVVVGRRPGIDVLRFRGIRCADVEVGGWHVLFEEPPGARPPAAADLRPRHVLAFLNDLGGRVARNLEALFPDAVPRVFPGRPPDGGSVHAALRLAGCAAEAGLPVDPEGCLAAAGEAPLLEAGCGKRAGLVIHPGSGGSHKNLSPGFWGVFAERLRAETAVTLLLGPAEERLLPRFQGCSRLGTVVSPDTEELLSLLGRAACCVGHDSGISHLAAMLGTPTVALFRVSNPAVWRPLGPQVRVIEARSEDGGLLGRLVATAREALRTGRIDRRGHGR